MLVSIVVITFNSEKYIMENLNSILIQNYQDLEVIISDDCSVDNTCYLVEEWIKNNSEKFVNIQLIKSEINTGICKNFNRGCKVAAGKFIKPIAGDDYFKDQYSISNLVSEAKKRKVDILFSKSIAFNRNNGINKVIDIYPDIKTQSIFKAETNMAQLSLLLLYTPPANTFISKALLDEINYIDEDFFYIEDYILFVKILLTGRIFHFLDKETVYYRQHIDSVSRHDDSFINLKLRQERLAVNKRYLSKVMRKIPLIYKISYFNKCSIEKLTILLGNTKRIHLIIRYFRLFDPIFYRTLSFKK